MQDNKPNDNFSKASAQFIAAAALLAIIYYFIPWKNWTVLSKFLGLPFLALFSSILPGLAIARRIFPEKLPTLAKLTLSALCGSAFLLLVSFFWALFGGSLASFIRFWPLFLLPLALVHALKPPSPEQLFISHSKRGGIAHLFFIVLVTAIFFLVLKSGPPLDFTKDTLDHVGYISEIRESGEIFPTNAFYHNAGPNGQDLRKGLLNFLYAFSGEYLGLDALHSLKQIDAFLAALMLLVIYSATLLLFRNVHIAIMASAFFLISVSGGLGSSFIRETLYPARFAFVYFLFFLVSSLSYLDSMKFRRLAGVLLFAFAASAAHVFYAILIGFSVLVIVLWKPCFPRLDMREHMKRATIIGFAALAGILPYLLFRYIATYHGANVIHTEVQGVVFITKNLFIADPIKLQRWFGSFGIVTFLTLFPLWRFRGENTGLGFLIASFLTVPLILLNPFVLPPLHRLITYLAFRLKYICPFYILAAVFYSLSVSAVPRTKLRAVFINLLVVLLSLTVLLNIFHAFRKNTFSREELSREKVNSYHLWLDGLEFLQQNISPGSIIVSDPITSYSIPAFTSHYVVSTLDQHAPPNDLRLSERVKAARGIISPFVSLARTTELLQAERASYIVLNARIPKSLPLHYWLTGPETSPHIKDKFISRPDIFETVFEQRGFVVMHWNGKHASKDTAAANPYYLQAIPAGFQMIGQAAGEATLEASHLYETEAERGGKAVLELVWSAGHPLPLGNYAVAVRFDCKDVSLPFAGKPYPKITRKISEKIRKERYRFRRDHKIASGFLSPDVWPEGALVLDEFTVDIPDNIAAGRYDVSAKVLKVPKQHTFRLRDFFYDEDIYQGVKIGEINIH